MPKKGYRQTPEHRRKIGAANSIALKGRHLSPSHIAALTGRKLSHSHIANRTEAQTLHGESRAGHLTSLYRTWDSMIQRCRPQFKQAKDYYDRGIRVYLPWCTPRTGFIAFRDYVLATIGPKPKGLSLDRIDNDGWYVPGNIRWATRKEQQANRRCSRAKV